MHADSHIELFTVLTINSHPTSAIGIHRLNNMDGPLVNIEAPQSPPKDSPGDPIKSFLQIDEYEEKWFVGSTVFLLQLADNKYCICGALARNKPDLLTVNAHHLANIRLQHSL